MKWQYYTNSFYDLWTAPSGIAHICWGVPYQGQTAGECTYSDFTSHVWEPAQNFLSDDFKGGGTNINAPPPGGGQRPVYCNLPNVAWIVPNGFWSDHPGLSTSHYDSTEFDLGPDWVAAIINSIGNATCVEPPGTPRNMGGMSPWNDTVIFVVWDDWGGWYDHVGAGLGSHWGCSSWGCGYTYGYRVPFLVVSEWTQSYVSGACGILGEPACGPLSNIDPYRHDFGSILAFIEENFNLPVGGINPGYLFADAYYPEQYASPPGLPLGDFFNLWQNGNGIPRPFGNGIAVAGPYPTSYFLNYQGPVTDPDNDVIDND